MELVSLPKIWFSGGKSQHYKRWPHHRLKTSKSKERCCIFWGYSWALSYIYICIRENNNKQSASPRWNTSVILFMHLSLLALLPCVLSLGGHVVPQKADMPGLRSEGAVGAKIGSFMSTQRKPALNTSSGPSPVHQCSFHKHLLDLQEQHVGLVGETFLRKE